MAWQLAKIIRNDIHPEEVGRTFWVDGRTVTALGAWDMDDETPADGLDVFTTNLLDGRGTRVSYYAELVELQPVFATDVEWVPFAKWRAEGTMRGVSR